MFTSSKLLDVSNCYQSTSKPCEQVVLEASCRFPTAYFFMPPGKEKHMKKTHKGVRQKNVKVCQKSAMGCYSNHTGKTRRRWNTGEFSHTSHTFCFILHLVLTFLEVRLGTFPSSSAVDQLDGSVCTDEAAYGCGSSKRTHRERAGGPPRPDAELRSTVGASDGCSCADELAEKTTCFHSVSSLLLDVTTQDSVSRRSAPRPAELYFQTKPLMWLL